VRTTRTCQPRALRRGTAAFAVLLVAGCGGTPRPVAYEDLTPRLGALEFTHITVDVAHDRRELLEVLERNNPGRKIALPPIDYSRRETFLVAAGPRSSTGYALHIVSVEDKGGFVKVTIREQTPSLGERVRPRLTFPYRLLVIDSHKSVHLKWLGRP
jgi:PrcB C-terminal